MRSFKTVRIRTALLILILFALLGCSLFLYFARGNNNDSSDIVIRPDGPQSIKVNITSVTDGALYCVNNEEIEGSEKLGFRHFDKGSQIIIEPKEGFKDFSDTKYKPGDNIEVYFFDCEEKDGKYYIAASREHDIYPVKDNIA